MDEKIELKVASRENASPEKLRKEGIIPGVLYGKEIKNKSLQIKEIDFIKTYQKAGESTLVDLKLGDSNPIKVLIKDVQRNNVTDKIQHVDFYQVNMQNKITAEINLVFTGIAPAVKELNGILVKNTTSIEVKCLPGDLVKEITVDISRLKTFEDMLYVKDIQLPPKIELLTDVGIIIAQVTPPRSDEELKALDETVKEDVDKVEVTEKKPAEEETPTEETGKAEKKEEIKK
jgi:large subunit ribosomal protein L25